MAGTSELGSEKIVYRYVFYRQNEDGTETTVRAMRTNDRKFAERVFLRDCKTHGELHVHCKISSSPMHVGVAK